MVRRDGQIYLKQWFKCTKYKENLVSNVAKGKIFFILDGLIIWIPKSTKENGQLKKKKLFLKLTKGLGTNGSKLLNF